MPLELELWLFALAFATSVLGGVLGMASGIFIVPALTMFARRLGVSVPSARLGLKDPDPLVLVVHAAALLAVADHAVGLKPQQATSEAQVLDGLLKHESRKRFPQPR